jgi:hypothetical protein
MSNLFYEKKTHETLEYIRELECINNIDLSWLNDVVIDCILSGGLIKPKIEYDNCNLFLKWENNYFCAIALIDKTFANLLLFNENFTFIHEFNNLEIFSKTIKRYFYRLIIINNFKYIKSLEQGWYDGNEGCSYNNTNIQSIERFIIELQKKCSYYLYVYPSLDNSLLVEFNTNINFFSIIIDFDKKEYQFEKMDLHNNAYTTQSYKFLDEQKILENLSILLGETYEG